MGSSVLHLFGAYSCFMLGVYHKTHKRSWKDKVRAQITGLWRTHLYLYCSTNTSPFQLFEQHPATMSAAKLHWCAINLKNHKNPFLKNKYLPVCLVFSHLHLQGSYICSPVYQSPILIHTMVFALDKIIFPHRLILTAFSSLNTPSAITIFALCMSHAVL